MHAVELTVAQNGEAYSSAPQVTATPAVNANRHFKLNGPAYSQS